MTGWGALETPLNPEPRFHIDEPDKQATSEPFAIVVSAALWRGFDVTVEPALARYPLQHRRTFAEAMAYAEQVSRLEGWPIRDRTGGAGDDPPRAA